MKNLDQYLNHIRTDYNDWILQRKGISDMTETKEKMIAEFCGGICVHEGSKYLKICTDNGDKVHSFIVKKDNNKFRAGDILKAASYNAPATNFARGNILEGNWKTVRWTGA